MDGLEILETGLGLIAAGGKGLAKLGLGLFVLTEDPLLVIILNLLDHEADGASLGFLNAGGGGGRGGRDSETGSGS